MRALFIHQNFPGQFRNLAPALAARGNEVRALAITSKQRSALMPDLPTVDEAGVPGYEYHTWFGLWAPQGTPRPIVEILHAEVRKALADPTVVDGIKAKYLDTQAED